MAPSSFRRGASAPFATRASSVTIGSPRCSSCRRRRRPGEDGVAAASSSRGRGATPASIAASITNSNDSIWTRYRFSLPLELRRISNVELPREGMLPET